MSVSENTSMPPRGVLVVLVATAVVLAWAAQGQAQEPEPIPVVAGFADHKALGDGLKRRIREAVSGQLESRTAGRVSWAVMPEEWRGRAGRAVLAGLTPAMCREAKLDQGVQGLMLWVGYKKGSYLVSCAVFHHQFDDVIVSRVVSIVDRRLVVNNVKRLVQRVWRTVGEIVQGQGASLVVSVAVAGDRTTDTLPEVGSPLEVLRVVERRDGRKVQAWPGRFLVVREHRDVSTVLCSAVSPGQQVPEFFRHVGKPNVRYLVRSMKSRRGPTRIRVVSDSDGRPREGCAVYVSEEKPPGRYPSGPADGLTDEAGFFSVPFRGHGFRHVTVVCGYHFMTETVASGQGAFPVVFRMPRNAPAKQSQAVLERVKRRVKEVEDWLSVITVSANQVVQDKDEGEIEKVITALERYSSWQRIRQELEALRTEFTRHATSGEQGGFNKLVADVQMEIERLSKDRQDWRKNIDITKTNLRNVRSARLVDEYTVARKALKWREAVAALEELAEVTPDDQKVKMLLARFHRALQEHSREHGQARRIARDGLLAETAAEVLSSWRDTVKSIRVLIREDDGPELWSSLKGLDMSIKLLADDSKAIARRVAAAGDDLGDDERQRLEDRSQLIKAALIGLNDAGKDARKLVRDFFNQ